MYKAAIRALMKHSIKKLNAGDYGLMLKMASTDFEMVFPGDNSWAAMFGPIEKGRAAHVTHHGIAQGSAFAERFVDDGVQFHIEDILVNGPPWNTRIALRVQSYIPGEAGGPDVYNNRAVAILEVRWGRLVRWEDYEDTERVAAWDNAGGDTATESTVAESTVAESTVAESTTTEIAGG